MWIPRLGVSRIRIHIIGGGVRAEIAHGGEGRVALLLLRRLLLLLLLRLLLRSGLVEILIRSGGVNDIVDRSWSGVTSGLRILVSRGSCRWRNEVLLTVLLLLRLLGHVVFLILPITALLLLLRLSWTRTWGMRVIGIWSRRRQLGLLIRCAGWSRVSQYLDCAGIKSVSLECWLLVSRLVDAVRILLVRLYRLSGGWYLLNELTLGPS